MRRPSRSCYLLPAAVSTSANRRLRIVDEHKATFLGASCSAQVFTGTKSANVHTKTAEAIDAYVTK